MTHKYKCSQCSATFSSGGFKFVENGVEFRLCRSCRLERREQKTKENRKLQSKKRYGLSFVRKELIAERGSQCEQCGISSRNLEAHHKKPLSAGGTHAKSNLVLLCKSCHKAKHSKKANK